ncbi:MAG: hypothetical protein EOP90_07225 [Lysobacteraceae bacterium]|nr:MAG: hypothetical protein EOP90_07225 [Xanthomonadaceae bacterium]
MGLQMLSTGWAGVWQAAAIACGLGLLLSVLAHLLAPRLGWREGSAIGVALLLALVLGAGVDAWQLFHLSIVRLESPYVIQRTLAAIHDPGMLGVRVLFEFLGAIAGVMAGWFLWAARSGR